MWFYPNFKFTISKNVIEVQGFFGVILMFAVLFCIVGAVVALLYYIRMLFSKQKKNTNRVDKIIELKRRERRFHIAKGKRPYPKTRQP